MQTVNILDKTFTKTTFSDANDGLTFDDIDVAARLTSTAMQLLQSYFNEIDVVAVTGLTREQVIDHLQRDAVQELRGGALFVAPGGMPYFQADETDFDWYVDLAVTESA